GGWRKEWVAAAWAELHTQTQDSLVRLNDEGPRLRPVQHRHLKRLAAARILRVDHAYSIATQVDHQLWRPRRQGAHPRVRLGPTLLEPEVLNELRQRRTRDKGMKHHASCMAHQRASSLSVLLTPISRLAIRPESTEASFGSRS